MAEMTNAVGLDGEVYQEVAASPGFRLCVPGERFRRVFRLAFRVQLSNARAKHFVEMQNEALTRCGRFPATCRNRQTTTVDWSKMC
jgi:hypothetical protein